MGCAKQPFVDGHIGLSLHYKTSTHLLKQLCVRIPSSAQIGQPQRVSYLQQVPTNLRLAFSGARFYTL
jgi:hypothetical protein